MIFAIRLNNLWKKLDCIRSFGVICSHASENQLYITSLQLSLLRYRGGEYPLNLYTLGLTHL